MGPINLLTEPYSFLTPRLVPGGATQQGSGGGRDSFKSYTYVDSGAGRATVNNGKLSYVSSGGTRTFTSGYMGSNSGPGINPWANNFQGTFDPQTWQVRVGWNSPTANGGTSVGSYIGTLTEPKVGKTDFVFSSGEWITAGADALHNDSHSVNDVARAIGAHVVLTVNGQHIKTSAMGNTVADVRLFWANGPTTNDILPGGQIGSPIPVHWNTDKIDIKVSDIFSSSAPPANARYLLATVDYSPSKPGGEINEVNESNNVFALKLGFDASVQAFGFLDGGVVGIPDSNQFQVALKYSLSTFGIPSGTSHIAEVYWSNASGANLGPIITRIGSGLDRPNTTDGEFLVITPSFKVRPAGATMLAASVTIAPAADVNTGDNRISIALPELTPVSFAWLDVQTGKAQFNYSVSSFLPFKSAIHFAWTDGPSASANVIANFNSLSLPQFLAAGPHSATVIAGDLAKRPAGAKYLRAWIDQPTGGLPQGSILEPNESNNVLALFANVAPTLNITPSPKLPNIGVNVTNSTGATVASLLGTAVTDPDLPSLRGIAVTSAVSSGGVWQYSLNGGSSWLSLTTASGSAARLLDPQARVRFVPKLNFSGTATFSYSAWDQTQGQRGGVLATAGRVGSAGSMSLAVETASITVK